MRRVRCVEREPCGAKSLVVTGDAVLIDDCFRRGWRCGRGVLRLTCPDLDARDGRDNPAADEERQGRGHPPHAPIVPYFARSIPFFSITELIPPDVRND